ncbi:hypothetical protein JCM9140_4255 [Halalkalibacter wakoensis JCM 9140]|uniref:Uncharacterized protein n=1 Tax=Halalkalibacter wakoensis JCM 9140 TaxID=1236970 RepID=W4Q7X4_9BACI|nr:hypothetical protein [Halalkalibacter wakoensis]GAE28065.1 hypothetical protein JCM9140_4255 [Halalkalibacter wakoensis JCM 9140]
MDIRIIASQIQEVFMPTELVEGKDRLDSFFLSYGYLEGKSVIEPLKNGKYRLISYCENYQYYKRNHPLTPFTCTVMYFNSDNERYMELLKQLYLGKARSNFYEKYIIVNKLLQTFKLDELSGKTRIPKKAIKNLIFSDDKYKPLLEFPIKINRRSVTESIIKLLNSSIEVKQKTEVFLLNQALSLEPYIKLTTNNVKNLEKEHRDGSFASFG